jgi:hypothetical protein
MAQIQKEALMNLIPRIGAFVIGIIVGLIIRYLLRRLYSSIWKPLGSILAVLIGGTALWFIGARLSDFWNYAIGILLGLFIYTVFVMFSIAPRKGVVNNKKPPRNKKDQSEEDKKTS